jgi:lysophospholipase L1-like esterase
MNKNRSFGAICLLAAMITSISGVWAAEKTDAEQTKPLPRVLLIGDSICGGYQLGVKKLLEGKAEVVKNEGNAEYTGTGIKKLDEWLGDGKWDVIHFNWGLWDVAYRNPESKNFGHLDKVGGKVTTPLPEYEKNLRALVARMKKTGATLVWASTTPVPDGEPGRIKGDEVRYNAVAAKIMAENGVAIDDLYAAVLPQLGKLQNPQNVHFAAGGNTLLAQQVADSILAALAGRGKAGTAGKVDAPQSKPLPRVLLIGDSISGGYQLGVKKLLEGKAEVVKNEGNAQHTGTGLEKLDGWLGDGKWDVIHFNWGLWDMYGWQYTKEDRTPPMYEKRLETLVARLEKTGAKLIWATTTPACPEPEGTMLKRWKTELTITPDVERQYLDAALRVMKKHNIQIDDLHALMLPELKKYSSAPDNVHFTGAGYSKLGKQVADAILQQLDAMGKDKSKAK